MTCLLELNQAWQREKELKMAELVRDKMLHEEEQFEENKAKKKRQDKEKEVPVFETETDYWNAF